MPDPLSENNKFLKVLLHLLFLVSGSATVLIGQVLPILARHYDLNDLQLSFYFPSQFAGSLIGTLVNSLFARRSNYLSAAIIGASLMATGLLLLNVDSFAVSLIAFGVNGLGIGMTLPSINMLVLELSPDNAPSALSVLNFCWGFGAILCKPFVDISSRGTNIGMTTLTLAVSMLVFAAVLYFQRVKIGVADPARSEVVDTEDVPIWTLPLAWAIAFFNFVHVGFESGMGGWLTTYSERLDSSHSVTWLSPTLAYFALFVFGRAAAPVFFRYLNENRMLMLGLLTILAGMLTTVMAPSVWMLVLGASISGFGTSWIFPTNVSRFSKTFGRAATRRATPFFICGTLGAASSTWLIGFVSDQTGSLRAGMYVLVFAVIILIVLQTGFATRFSRSRVTLSTDPV